MIRIVAGRFRSRQLKAPPGLDTRPTNARVRKALFDILGAHLEGARVADLFAGTGALGLEALSRGATSVDFFESGRVAGRVLRDNIASLGVEAETRIHAGALPLSLGPGDPFDLILVDPPWRRGLELPVLGRLLDLGRLAPDGLIVIEHDSRDAEVAALVDKLPLRAEDSRTYGDTGLLILTHADLAPTSGETSS